MPVCSDCNILKLSVLLEPLKVLSGSGDQTGKKPLSDVGLALALFILEKTPCLMLVWLCSFQLKCNPNLGRIGMLNINYQKIRTLELYL